MDLYINEQIARPAYELAMIDEEKANENIVVHAVPRHETPAWLMRKRAEGFELDLKLWAGLWMIEHHLDGRPRG